MNYNSEQEIITTSSTVPNVNLGMNNNLSKKNINQNQETDSQNIFQVMQEKQKRVTQSDNKIDELDVQNEIVEDINFMDDVDVPDDDYDDEKNSDNEILSDIDNVSDIDVSDDDINDTPNVHQLFDYKRKEALEMYHPECRDINYEEMISLSNVIRDNKGHIIDPLHKTIPILTKFEETKVLGIRISQLENGSDPLIHIDDNVGSNYIAEKELQEGVLPFIICRPLPGGKKEFWKLKDLEMFRAF